MGDLLQAFGKKPDDTLPVKSLDGGEDKTSPSSEDKTVLEEVKSAEAEQEEKDKAKAQADAERKVKLDEIHAKRLAKVKEHTDLMAGRLESDIPHNDEYWKQKQSIQQFMHELDAQEKKL